MSVTWKWTGLDELKAALRRLPDECVEDATGIVVDEIEQAATQIRNGYPRRTGYLRRGVSTSIERSRFGVIGIVKNTTKDAYWFEHGTQARHTKLGANRGAMPPQPVFGRTMPRRRRSMYARLKELLASKGLLVTGDA